ncbi:hypothetical protein BJY52DRAFT_454882 [Lactarius psammicola]|nr:hypothetical protein BJY52DRAFT_454882 [Lactarius psammicola]
MFWNTWLTFTTTATCQWCATPLSPLSPPPCSFVLYAHTFGISYPWPNIRHLPCIWKHRRLSVWGVCGVWGKLDDATHKMLTVRAAGTSLGRKRLPKMFHCTLPVCTSDVDRPWTLPWITGYRDGRAVV